jgi:hypothetical protein
MSDVEPVRDILANGVTAQNAMISHGIWEILAHRDEISA